MIQKKYSSKTNRILPFFCALREAAAVLVKDVAESEKKFKEIQ